MEQIIITIPDGLTPTEEIFAIAKKLGKALAPPKKQIAIGDGYTIKQLETQITIKREPTSKLLVTQVCSVCEVLFEPKEGFILYVNYGGITQQRRYCCEKCRTDVIELCGEGRAAIKKSKLKPVRTFDRSTRREHIPEMKNPVSLRNMTPFTAWDLIAKQGLE